VRKFRATLLAILGILIIASPVLAAAYSATFVVTETASTDYDMLAIQEDADNLWMSANDFMETDALDTRVETLGGVEKPSMVADDRILAAIPVPADSQTNLYFTTGNSDRVSMDIIAGLDGYYTIPDAAALEPGDDFEIEITDAWVDTDAGADKNLVYKESAFITYISDTEEITSAIPLPATPETLLPTGVGDETNISNSTGATHWDEVNDSNDATYVSQQVGGWARDLYATANHTIGTGFISQVKIICRGSPSAGDGPKLKTALKTNGTVYDGSEETLTAGWQDYSTTYITNPQTGTFWTWAEIDAMQIGTSILQSVSDPRCSEVYAEVIYSASVTATGVASGEHTVTTTIELR